MPLFPLSPGHWFSPQTYAPGRLSSRGVLSGCALAGLLVACGGPNAGYWRGGRDWPRPFPPVELEVEWQRPSPLCPSEVSARDGVVLRGPDPETWVDLEGATVDAPRGDPFESVVSRADADRVDQALLTLYPNNPPRTDLTRWRDWIFVAVPEQQSVHAFHRRQERLRWTVRVGAQIQVAPQVYQGRVVVQSLDNYVYCLRVDNGHEHWRARASHRLTRPVAFWRDRIFLIPETSDVVHALDLFDGSPVGHWNLPEEDQMFVSGPAVDQDLLYAAYRRYGSSRCDLVSLRLEATDAVVTSSEER